jgi:hypothetical protein
MMRDDTVLGRYNGLVILRLEMMVTDALACSKNTVDTRPVELPVLLPAIRL